MGEVKKLTELYRMLGRRCRAGGHSRSQAEYYNEVADFIRDCFSLETVKAKTRDSKFYKGESIAQIKDKIRARYDAANVNGMDRLAAVYRDKLQDIDEDMQAAFTTGYEKNAKYIKNKYLKTMEVFCRIFLLYIDLRMRDRSDHAEEHFQNSVHRLTGELSLPSHDFAQLARMPRFRNLICCSDEEYNKFVAAVTGEGSPKPRQEFDDSRADEEFEEIWEHADSLKEKANSIRGLKKAPPVLVIAPSDDSGSYRYLEITGDDDNG
ncbi:MAG: hypothetical protein ACOX4I_03355 [Anaerovoracaceae bacterium]|jgi:hypothetical protein